MIVIGDSSSDDSPSFGADAWWISSADHRIVIDASMRGGMKLCSKAPRLIKKELRLFYQDGL
jgi:hypothetical protein